MRFVTTFRFSSSSELSSLLLGATNSFLRRRPTESNLSYFRPPFSFSRGYYTIILQFVLLSNWKISLRHAINNDDRNVIEQYRVRYSLGTLSWLAAFNLRYLDETVVRRRIYIYGPVNCR